MFRVAFAAFAVRSGNDEQKRGAEQIRTIDGAHGNRRDNTTAFSATVFFRIDPRRTSIEIARVSLPPQKVAVSQSV